MISYNHSEVPTTQSVAFLKVPLGLDHPWPAPRCFCYPKLSIGFSWHGAGPEYFGGKMQHASPADHPNSFTQGWGFPSLPFLSNYLKVLVKRKTFKRRFQFEHLWASTCSSWAPVFCPLFFAPHGTSMALTFVPLHSVSLTDPTPSLTSQQLRHNVVPRSGATRHFWTSVPWIKLEHGILEVCVVWLEGCHRNGINDGNESFPRLK